MKMKILLITQLNISQWNCYITQQAGVSYSKYMKNKDKRDQNMELLAF